MILDGQNAQRVLYQAAAYTTATATVWDGFTITRGRMFGAGGGGATLRANGILRHCKIHDNISTYNNSSSNMAGGGVYMYGGTLDHCEIYDNIAESSYNGSASAYGGGVYVNSSTAQTILSHCRIYGNQAKKTSTSYTGYAYGGAVYVSESNCYIHDCEITGNSSTGSAGGVYVRGKNASNYATLENCVVSNNVSNGEGGGGGVYAYMNYVKITGCLVSNNTARSNGGGIYAYGASTIYLTSNTIVNNLINSTSSSYHGGGVSMGSSNVCKNNIVWGNYRGTTLDQVYPTSSGNVTYCAIEAEYSGTGNIQLDHVNTAIDMNFHPCFVSPTEGAGADYVGGDWTLQSESACVNMGTDENLGVVVLPEKDLAGNDRIQYGKIDIGAYESPYNKVEITPDANGIIYVKLGGEGSGESWDEAVGNLQYAINRAATFSPKAKVWVKEGTYMGDGTSENAFTIAEGVKVYGSFQGTEDPATFDLAERDFVAHPTILDGQNTQRVLYQSASFTDNNRAVWDGFVIQNGNISDHGAGVYLRGNTNLYNFRIRNNTSRGDNHYGGGLCVSSAVTSATADTIVNCVIENNQAYYGGGMNASYVRVFNTVIANNTATSTAGGVYVERPSIFVNTTIVSNLCSISSTGGIYAGNASTSSVPTQMINCIVWGNKKSSGVSNIEEYNSNGIMGRNSAIEGGYQGFGVMPLSAENTGEGVCHPCFVNPSEGAGKAYSGGDWTLGSHSIGINAGRTDTWMPATDIVGNARVQQGKVDLGAYESRYDTYYNIVPSDDNVIYVTMYGAGTKDGSSWANATPHLQLAVNMANSFAMPAQVWVAQGNYQDHAGLNTTASFEMAPGVNVFGGFAGNETSVSQRDFRNHVTTLDGANVKRVLNQRFDFNASTWCAWDGFTIKNGKSINSNQHGSGVNMKAYISLRNCTITQNNDAYYAALYASGTSACYDTIVNCIVKDNTNSFTGGVYTQYCLVNNCLVAGNHSTHSYGGVYAAYGTMILNSTIVNNTATTTIGGLNASNSNVTVVNSILWGNTANGQPSQMDNSATVSYSAVQGGYVGVGNINLSGNNTGDANSPMFNNDWSLQDNSILVNKGIVDDLPIPATDLAGNQRVAGGSIDLGAFETSVENAFDIQPDANGIVYVSLNGTGNGSSWAQAAGDLQFVLNRAVTMNPRPVVWVSGGVYYSNGSDVNAFYMMEGVNVFGGFAGNEPANYDLSQRDFLANATILDGRNEGRVLMQIDNFTANTQTTWDGFTIRNGYRSSSSGGGGAGAYLKNYGHLRNCIIRDNIAGDGAGVYVNGSSSTSTTLTDCEILNNTSNGSGGGVYLHYGEMINCKLTGNTCTSSGGGVYVSSTSDVVGCLIADNESQGNNSGGGGICFYSYASSSKITNTTIVNNKAKQGGGIYSSTSSITVTNSVLYGNTVNGTANQINTNYTPTLSHCAVEGGYEGVNIISTISEADFIDYSHGVYRLAEGSSCINAGVSVSNLPENDLAGNQRVQDGTVDLGAYEYQCLDYAYRQRGCDESGYHFYGALLTEPGVYERQFAVSGHPCDSLVVLNLSLDRAIMYVTTMGAGTKDGSSWANASDDLNQAVFNMSLMSGFGSRQVWVAEGTYTSTSSPGFTMREGVKVYGGFMGNETALSQRNPETHPTILRAPNKTLLQEAATTEDLAFWDGFVLQEASKVVLRQNNVLVNCIVKLPVEMTNTYLEQCSFSDFTSASCLINANASNLVNCMFENLTASRLIEGTGLTMSGCQITNCTQSSSSYSMIALNSSEMTDCTITSNNVTRLIEGTGLTMSQCQISGNTQTGSLSNAWIALNGGQVEDCEIFGNSLQNVNMLSLTNAQAQACNIHHNTTKKTVLRLNESTLSDSKIFNNTSQIQDADNYLYGGIINAMGGSVISHCDIVNNNVASTANLYSLNGQLYNIQGSGQNEIRQFAYTTIAMRDAELRDCILWGNAQNVFANNIIAMDTLSAVNYCAIEGSLYNGIGNIRLSGANTGRFAPCFANPTMTAGHLDTQNDYNWTLTDNSVCLKQGSEGSDIGASTSNAPATIALQASSDNVIYVAPESSGAGDGSSWADATSDLQFAVARANTFNPIAQVWVKEGIYYGDGIANNNAFNIVEGVDVFGGFVGTETSIEQRNLAEHSSILDGQGVQRVLYQDTYFEAGTSTIWDGFVIRNGHLNEADFFNLNSHAISNKYENYDIAKGVAQVNGAGAAILRGAVLRNCTFENNLIVAESNASSYYANCLKGTQVSVVGGGLENCIIVGSNLAHQTWNSYKNTYLFMLHGTIDNCIISNNIGKMGLYDANVAHTTINNNQTWAEVPSTDDQNDPVVLADKTTFTNCYLTRNKAVAVNKVGHRPNRYVNTEFTFNEAVAVMRHQASYGDTFVNCNILSNRTRNNNQKAVVSGGVFHNTVIWNNRDAGNNTMTLGSNAANTTYFTFNNCAIEMGVNGVATDEVKMLATSNRGNSSAYDYPCFIAPESGNFYVSSESALVDAGDNAVVTELHDILCAERIQNGIVDIGTHEYGCLYYREYAAVTENVAYPFYGEWITEPGQYTRRWTIEEGEHIGCDSIVVLNLYFKRTMYVTETGSGLRNGISWENAFGDLKQALDSAGMNPNYKTEIWVKKGVYRGDGTSVNAFQIYPNITMYGGLNGNELGNYDMSQRDLERNISILDGDYIQRVLVQEENFTEETASYVDGFTIKNGFSRQGVSSGTAIEMKRHLHFRNCIITENYTNGEVGAIFSFDSDFASCDQKVTFNTFTNCKITNNQGLYAIKAGHIAMDNCEISGNDGHGLMVLSYANLKDCKITSNGGRGFYMYDGFRKYVDDIWGIEKYTMDMLDMENCFVTNNAGGIFYKIPSCNSAGHGDASIVGSVIANNRLSASSGDTEGGAIYLTSGKVRIYSSTIINNRAIGDGGALYGDGFELYNTLLYGNKASSKANQLSNYVSYSIQCVEGIIYVESFGPQKLEYCAVEGGYPGLGNIALNGEDLTPGLNGYNLKNTSVCINAGCSQGYYVPEYDILGNDRVRQGCLDIGAYETDFTGREIIVPSADNIIYVSAEGQGNKTGSSWDNATPYFQTAMNRAAAMEVIPQIWVKAGEYSDESFGYWDAFTMMPGVNVYGGFAGNESASFDLSQRNFNQHKSVLNGKNSKRPLGQLSDFTEDKHSTWSGFVVKNGDSRQGYKANILSLSQSQIDHIAGTYYKGGGVWLRDYGHIDNFEIVNNNSYYGGGLYKNASSNGGHSMITNSRIHDNFATEEGGGLMYERPFGGFSGTSIKDTIVNCEISHNHADRYGGMVAARTLVSNSTIVHNTTDLYAFDTIANKNQYNVYDNCVFWGNSSRNYANQIEGTNNTYSYCAIQGGYPGTGNINIEKENDGDAPELHYARFLDADHQTYRLTESSAMVDVGNNATVISDCDHTGAERIYNDRVDMGAYELGCVNYRHLDVIANMQYVFYDKVLTESGHYEHQWHPDGAACDSLVSLDLELRQIWYVTQFGAGTKDGTSWENATDNLQWAINQAAESDVEAKKQIWVAAGTYRGNGASQQAFTLKPNVEIYGGFAGNEVSNINFDARDFEHNETILEGSSSQRVLGNYGNEADFTPNKRGFIDGFTIQHGYTTGKGGGVYIKRYITIQNCVVKNNQGGQGAGIYAEERCEITDCDIVSNTALTDGGGVYCQQSVLTYCNITNNLIDNVNGSATKRGGGIYGSNATINNCLIANNSVLTDYAYGGGMYIDNSSVQSQLLNTTVVNNYSHYLGGGVYSVNSSSNNEFINCILWGNRTDLNTQQIAVSASNVPIYLRYCAVQGGACGLGTINLSAENGDGQFSPRFLAPTEDVGANFYNGDWRIQDNSICVNAGERLVYSIEKDLDGEVRVKNGRIDIGAYETVGTTEFHVTPDADNIIYVNKNATGTDWSGSSWANAIPDLQLAINFAADNDGYPSIWVAQGTYTGNGWPYIDAFIGLNGINLYGGFVGNEPADYDLSQRNFNAHATILDGQNIQRAFQQAHSHYFKYSTDPLHYAIYDGFTFRNDFVHKNMGGNVYMQKGELHNVIIENGDSQSFNSDGYGGGGMYASGAGAVKVYNGVFRNNQTNLNGGAYCGNITFYNCLFNNNSAGKEGGAGAGTSAQHYNSTIVNNYASENGGGLSSASGIYNSIIWGNKIGENESCNLKTANRIENNVFSSITVRYSAIEGGYEGVGNITLNSGNDSRGDVAYPRFVEPTIGAGVAYNGGDWHLSNGSVCANMGNNVYANATDIDLDGTERIKNDFVDLGCYESYYTFDYDVVPDANNIIYVTEDGAGQMNGSSWDNATPYLQFALDRANTMNIKPDIWVASGTYHGQAVPVYPAFLWYEGIDLYGGFIGDEPANYDLDSRDFDAARTILDGENLQQILRHEKSSTAGDYLDGFVLQNGRSIRDGGAAHLVNTHVRNCYFEHNSMVWEDENSIKQHGGGALRMYSGDITHSTFLNNYSNAHGGAVYGSATLSHCLIKENNAVYDGGGVYSVTALHNSEVSFNEAGGKGGGVYGDTEIRNCDIVKNTASVDAQGTGNNGGGYYSSRFEKPVYNTIFWGNRCGAIVSNIRSSGYSNGNSIRYSAIEQDEYFPSGTANIMLQTANDGTDVSLNYVRFINPDDGDFQLMENSMCMDVGDHINAPADPYDLAGNDRIQGLNVDMGCYEHTPSNCPPVTNLRVPEDEITFTTVEVYWNADVNEDTWLVYYDRVGFNTPQLLTVNEPHCHIEGLLPNLSYFVKVRAICPEEESPYCAPVYFNTACDPDAIIWNNYLVEDNMLPARDQALESNSTVLFSWDYIEGADSYDLWLWRTDHGNGLPVPDFPVAYGLRNNYCSVNLDRSIYQGYGAYQHCDTWPGCDPEPPLYLHQYIDDEEYGNTEIAYYAWKVVAHKDCATIESDTMTFNTALPDLHVTALEHSYAQTGQNMTVTWTVRNDGYGPTLPGNTWNDYIVLSYPINWTTESFTNTPAESFIIASVPNLRALNVGESYTNSVDITVPDDMYGAVFLFVLSNWQPRSGMNLDFTQYGGVFPNPYNPSLTGYPYYYMSGTCSSASFHEVNECDNFFYEAIEVDKPPIPDLIAIDPIGPYEHVAGDSITLSWKLINQGGAGFNPTPVTDLVYYSTDSIFNSNAQQLGTYMDTLSMAKGDTIMRVARFATSVRDIDTFYFFVRTDSRNTVYESLFENNNLSPVSLHPTIFLPAPPPDLVIDSFTISKDQLSPNEYFDARYTIRNNGFVHTPCAAEWPSVVDSKMKIYTPYNDTLRFDDYPVRFKNNVNIVEDTIMYLGTGKLRYSYNEQQYEYALVDGIVRFDDNTMFIQNHRVEYPSLPPTQGDPWNDVVSICDMDTLIGQGHLRQLKTYTNRKVLYTADELSELQIVVNNVVEQILPDPVPFGFPVSRQDSLNYQQYCDSLASWRTQKFDYIWKKMAYTDRYTVDMKRLMVPMNYEEIPCWMFLQTDRGDNVFEYGHENNNIASVEAHVYQPDAIIRNMQLTSDRSMLIYDVENIGNGTILRQPLMLSVNYNNANIVSETKFLDSIAPHDIIHDTIALHLECNFYIENTLKLTASLVNEKDFTNNVRIDTLMLYNPDFLAESIVVPTELQSGQSFDVSYTFTNNGAIGYAGELITGIYLGLSPELNFITAQNLGYFSDEVSINVGETNTLTHTVTLPIDAEGPYYIYVYINDDTPDFYIADEEYRNHDAICEGDNVNTDYLVSDRVDVSLSPYPDLVPEELIVPEGVSAGSTALLNFTIRNNGIRATEGNETWLDAVYISQFPQFNVETATLLQTQRHTDILNVGESYSVDMAVTIPSGYNQDLCYFYLRTDANNEIFEYVGENNNILQSTPTSVVPYNCDLALMSISGEIIVDWGDTLSYSYTVRNLGMQPTVQSWYDRFYLSTDAIFDGNDIRLENQDRSHNSLGGSQQYDDNFTFIVPYGITGPYS